MNLAFSNKLSQEFITKFLDVCVNLQVNPNHLISCIAFESGETFSSNVKNKFSGAVGLIQFMPQTAASLGTTSEDLAEMTSVEQLDFVEKYFIPRAGKLKTLEDVYMAILWPAGIGKPLDYVLFDKNGDHPQRYIQNAGLDFNKDGIITKAEAAAKVRAKYEKGILDADFDLETYFAANNPKGLDLIKETEIIA